jgi:hypothetical protein
MAEAAATNINNKRNNNNVAVVSLPAQLLSHSLLFSLLRPTLPRASAGLELRDMCTTYILRVTGSTGQRSKFSTSPLEAVHRVGTRTLARGVHLSTRFDSVAGDTGAVEGREGKDNL